MKPSGEAIAALLDGTHADPFSLLGVHEGPEGAFARAVLIRDTNKQVSMACIRSPGVSDSEALRYASNRGLDDDIIRYIANHRPWLRLYGVKVALVNNPKCPMGVSMRLLPHLNVRDLKSLARSKGVPSALATAAKQMLSQRNA